MTRIIFNKTFYLFLCALMALAGLRTPAFADPDEDLQTLGMFYEGKDLAVSATRNPKPISQTAENITVITAADIEMMGAHTLLDVLNNVPGIQTDDRGSVGTFGGFTIQGADMFHVLVLQDGITLNFLGDGSSDMASIPVQHIERIEIVKGAGSSSWGSAMGGVINIVTKSPVEEKKLGGTLSFSAGERGTRDSRGEATGTAGSLGYYLYAGNLASDGFHPVTDTDANNLYGKLRWDLPEHGSLLFTIGYTRETTGEGGAQLGIAINDHRRYLLSSLSLNRPLNEQLDLDLSLRRTSRTIDEDITGAFSETRSTDESTYGGSAKITWRQGIQSLVAGADFDHGKFDFHSNFPDFSIVSDQHFKTDKWGVFLNDTLTFGTVAITPGIRYDWMQQMSNFISPSLGAAWSLNDKTILRAYAARGYSLPVILPDSTQENVITVQTGVETTHIPYLWLKATLFWNYISDHQSFDNQGNPFLQKELKQGVEAEVKTVPLFNTSLSAGYTFIDATDRDSGAFIPNIPHQIVKLGLHYNDKRSLRGTLLGRYLRWNDSPGNATKESAFIWDLNLAKKVFTGHDMAVELFFNAHNLFNGAQFNDPNGFENARRWLEGGIRCNF
ncbi:MAG TPA: TonB-dependent receptor [Geobacteraceae bacterium]